MATRVQRAAEAVFFRGERIFMGSKSRKAVILGDVALWSRLPRAFPVHEWPIEEEESAFSLQLLHRGPDAFHAARRGWVRDSPSRTPSDSRRDA